MDNRLKEVLASLPEKPPRSRLEPYRGFIEELRRRDRTYRDIASIFWERLGVRVTASGIHDFMRRRGRDAQTLGKAIEQPGNENEAVHGEFKRSSGARAQTQSADAKKRIIALKYRKATAKANPPAFNFDAGQPLRLTKSVEQGLEKDRSH